MSAWEIDSEPQLSNPEKEPRFAHFSQTILISTKHNAKRFFYHILLNLLRALGFAVMDLNFSVCACQLSISKAYSLRDETIL